MVICRMRRPKAHKVCRCRDGEGRSTRWTIRGVKSQLGRRPDATANNCNRVINQRVACFLLSWVERAVAGAASCDRRLFPGRSRYKYSGGSGWGQKVPLLHPLGSERLGKAPPPPTKTARTKAAILAGPLRPLCLTMDSSGIPTLATTTGIAYLPLSKSIPHLCQAK